MAIQCAACDQIVSGGNGLVARSSGPRALPGAGAAVCRVCHRRTLELLTAADPGTVVVADGGSSTQSNCSFCGKAARAVAGLVVWPRGAVCNECLALMTVIYAGWDQKRDSSAAPPT